MNESGYGPRTRRRASAAIVALLGVVLAMLPMTAHAATTGITVTSPTFEDDYTIGTAMEVTWATNASTPVNLELWNTADIATGTYTKQIRTNVAPKTGKVNWTIPVDVAPGTYKVKAYVVANNTINDFSDFAFNLQSPSLSVSAPKAADSWAVGTTHTIKWSLPAAGTVDIDLVDPATPTVQAYAIKTAVKASAGTYSWAIPVSIATAQNYQVRVKTSAGTYASPGLSALSGTFAITFPTVNVTNPGTINPGTTTTVKWALPIPGSVNVGLVDTANGNAVTPLKTTTAKPGSFTWAVPISLATGTNRYKIRVTAVSNSAITGDSTTFDATDAALAVSLPDASTTWTAGGQGKIRWSTKVTGSVQIDLVDPANGNAVVTNGAIASSVAAATGTYTWNIPLSITTGGSYKVQVKSKLNSAVVGLTPAFTFVAPTVTGDATAHTGWNAGTVQTVTWSTSLTSGNVVVSLVNTGTSVATVLKTVSRTASPLSVTIPATQALGTYKVRVAAAAAPSLVYGDSASFSIALPTLGVTTPGAAWVSGNRVTVSYTAPIAGNVAIELRTGSTLVRTITSSTPASTGSFSWDVPLNITSGSSMFIRVKSTANSAITVDSSTFQVDWPTLTLGSLAASVARSGSLSIPWTTTLPTTQPVKITATKGSTVVTVSNSTSSAALSANWSVPASLATGVWTIKVMAVNNNAIASTGTVTVT